MESKQWIIDTVRQLPQGAFLMVSGNPMTIGWAQFGVVWGKLCASVYVRQSRYTHTLLEHADTFTISVPDPDVMKSELAYCGTRSGRDGNKCEAIGKGLVPAKFGGQDGLAGCRYHIECKILHRSELEIASLEDSEISNHHYRNGDHHTQYIGEILGVTESDA